MTHPTPTNGGGERQEPYKPSKTPRTVYTVTDTAKTPYAPAKIKAALARGTGGEG